MTTSSITRVIVLLSASLFLTPHLWAACDISVTDSPYLAAGDGSTDDRADFKMLLTTHLVAKQYVSLLLQVVTR